MCGSPDIPLTLLKSVATYKGIEATAPLIQWFWEVMDEFTNAERSLFLRFVWGRTRLPRTIADFRGRDFVLQVWCISYTLQGSLALKMFLTQLLISKEGILYYRFGEIVLSFIFFKLLMLTRINCF